MGLAGCMQTLRWVVFIFNLLFWLAGMGMLGVGLWLRFDAEVAKYMSLHSELSKFYEATYLLIAAGAIMSILGFLGCCGALRKSQCMLVAFFIILVIVFILQLACGILAYTHQDSVKSYVEKSMYDTVYHYYNLEPAYKSVFDRIQRSFECCGVKTYRDWLSSYYSTEVKGQPELGVGSSEFGRVPESCCNSKGMKEYVKECGVSFRDMPLYTYEPFINQQGCSDVLYEKIHKNLGIMIGVAIGIGAFQLLGMIFSMMLCCWINHRKEEDRKTGRYDYYDS